jgi:hypothetical protein
MNGHETDISHGLWQFGGGRRICVGYRLAQRSLFINIARLIQCVDFKAVSYPSSFIKRSLDCVANANVQDGPYNPKILNLESTDEPFPVKATIRSDGYDHLILTEATRAGVLDSAKLDRDG